jgi:hypothetical protein
VNAHRPEVKAKVGMDPAKGKRVIQTPPAVQNNHTCQAKELSRQIQDRVRNNVPLDKQDMLNAEVFAQRDLSVQSTHQKLDIFGCLESITAVSTRK